MGRDASIIDQDIVEAAAMELELAAIDTKRKRNHRSEFVMSNE